MEIASFSPSLARSNVGSVSLSIILSPVQALMALFMPTQPASANHRPTTPATVQQFPDSPQTAGRAAAPVAMATRTRPHNRPITCLKIMREVEPGMGRSQAGRMAISGRMADVCAELDRIAQKEAQKA
jgi:hypothetical protein